MSECQAEGSAASAEDSRNQERLKRFWSELGTLAKDCGFSTLADRHSDELDFRDVCVLTMRAALSGAFRAGARMAAESSEARDFATNNSRTEHTWEQIDAATSS